VSPRGSRNVRSIPNVAKYSSGLSALICVFGLLLFHFVFQISTPVLKFLGWSLLL
jgi:hypothetical protein